MFSSAVLQPEIYQLDKKDKDKDKRVVVQNRTTTQDVVQRAATAGCKADCQKAARIEGKQEKNYEANKNILMGETDKNSEFQAPLKRTRRH